MKIEFEEKNYKMLYNARTFSYFQSYENKIFTNKNPNKLRIYEVTIDLPEFTCKCPFSGYPDFAKLQITYQPKNKVYELKSLKLYIHNFRDQKISHEEVVNRIMDDLIEAANPHWMHLNADFNPRGNVSMKLDLYFGEKKHD